MAHLAEKSLSPPPTSEKSPNSRAPQGSRVPVSLRTVRRELGMTQTDVASRAGMSQGDLSRLERRDDHLVSTLQRYIAALGGRIEVAAVFGSRRYPLELGAIVKAEAEASQVEELVRLAPPVSNDND